MSMLDNLDLIEAAAAEYAESLTPEGFEREMARAKEAGFEVIQSSRVHLLLDLDTQEAREQFDRVYGSLVTNFFVTGREEWKSKSGNTHMRITLAEPIDDAATRYAIQAALGSDGVKELLSIVRLLNGVTEPSRLFRPAS
jgi:hypothetical protein